MNDCSVHLSGIISYNNLETDFVLKDLKSFSLFKNVRFSVKGNWDIGQNDFSVIVKCNELGIPSVGKNANKFSHNEDLLAFFLDSISSKDMPVGVAFYYDNITKSTYLARNRFGTVPLFYIFLPNQLLAFSSNYNVLYALVRTKTNLTINRLELYHYLGGGESGLFDNNTSSSQIKTVTPGSYIKFSSDDFTQVDFSDYNWKKWNYLKSKEEFGEIFKELFFKSVSRSIGNLQSIGCHLSGGLDSSSVTSTVAHLYPDKDLKSYYCDTKTEWTDEKHYAIEVSKRARSAHYVLEPNETDLEDLIFYTSLSGQPSRSLFNPAFQTVVFDKAKRNGSEILMTGHAGDSIVGHGREEFFNELFIERDWYQLKIQFNHIVKADRTKVIFEPGWENFSISNKQKSIYEYYFYKKILSYVKAGQLRKSLDFIVTAYKYFEIIPSRWIVIALDNAIFKVKSKFKGAVSMSLLSENIKKEISELNAKSLSYDWMSKESFNSFRQIIFKQSICINEQLFGVSQFYKVPVSHPFYDPHLYELCRALSPAILFDNGLGRSALREAMKGILPESVRNRTSKARFSLYRNQGTLRLYNQSLDYLIEGSEIWEYANRKDFFKVMKLMVEAPQYVSGEANFTAYRILTLAVWLDMAKNNQFHQAYEVEK